MHKLKPGIELASRGCASVGSTSITAVRSLGKDREFTAWVERGTGAPCSDNTGEHYHCDRKDDRLGQVPTRADVELLRRSGTRIAIPG